jgi:hypothetical protein
MNLLQKAILSSLGLIAFTVAKAQDSTPASGDKGQAVNMGMKSKVPIGKPYFGNSLDGLIFSTALIDIGGKQSLGTLRFSAFFHIGGTYNYNFNKSVGIYTGLDIKNIGFIEKYETLNATLKQRVYTLGVPVGIRLGNMKTRDYFFMGGGLDVAVHYKYKFWSSTQSKIKITEWFSDNTELLLPYLFAGISVKGTTIKIQYYPTNLISPNSLYAKLYDPKLASPTPKANLLLFSVGKDLNFSKNK